MNGVYGVCFAVTAVVAAARPPQLAAQRTRVDAAKAVDDTAPAAHDRTVTHHTMVIGGQRIEYEAAVGKIVLRDDGGQPIASVYYTAYTRQGVADPGQRPITFAYNGGPGTASVMLNIGALGPRRVVLADTANPGPPPYGMVDNRYSLLDKTDLVFVDAVGTGFSRPLGKATGADFWGIDEDVRAQAQFITRYLGEAHRWNSPRYLAGESYGTTRVAALADFLQTHDQIDCNGLILISSVLNYATNRFDPGNDLPYILFLPSYAAVAWYHHVLPHQPDDLPTFLREAEHFATTDYAAALLAGSGLASNDRARVLAELHRFTGLSTDYIDKADLRVDASHFEKELLRARGVIIGRQDARFTGPLGDPLEESTSYDVSSAALFPAFASAYSHYLDTELNFKSDALDRYIFNGDVQPWDWAHDGNGPRGTALPNVGRPNVAMDLAEALNHDPRLRVLVNSGRFDIATPYFATRWTMDHLGLSADIRGHIRIVEYAAGHAVYVSEPALAELKQNLASFIDMTAVARAATSGVAP